MAEHIDHAVLFSGDGDFRRLVEAVQRKGVRVSVVSSVRSQPPMVADELRRQADSFIELQELMPRIQRDPALREQAMAARQQATYNGQQGADVGDEDEDDESAAPSFLTRRYPPRNNV
jgi:hypothetical protein